MQLPDRDALHAHLDALGGEGSTGGARRNGDSRCAVVVIGIADPDLSDLAPGPLDAVLVEVVRRVDRLVRASDLLAQMGPGRLALGLPLAPSAAGALVERVEGAVSMPIQLGVDLVSLPALVGVAFAADQPWGACSASDLVDSALADARLRGRQR